MPRPTPTPGMGHLVLCHGLPCAEHLRRPRERPSVDRVDTAQLAHVASEALQLMLWLSAPALLASVLVGLCTGLLQAATQIQDPALSFVPRLLAVAAALFVTAAWMSERLVSFTGALWRDIPRLLS